MDKTRGPRPGLTPGKKRKAPDDLSSNPHSVKYRQRIEAMSETEKRIERNKNNDRAAKASAVNKLRQTQMWKNASSTERESLERQKKDEIMEQRYRKRQSLKALLEDLGISDENTIFDDKHPEWEDIAFDDDTEANEFYRKDDIFSMEKLPSVEEAQEAYDKGVDKARHFSVKLAIITWRRLHLTALKALQSFNKKLRVLKKSALPPSITPHVFFTREERLIFRIKMLHSRNTWIEMPGPAQWWDNYSDEDFDKYWDVPSELMADGLRTFASMLWKHRQLPRNGELLTETILNMLPRFL